MFIYRNPATIDDDKKPQMNGDERRYVQAADFGKITHRKGRKERKAVNFRFKAFMRPGS